MLFRKCDSLKATIIMRPLHFELKDFTFSPQCELKTLSDLRSSVKTLVVLYSFKDYLESEKAMQLHSTCLYCIYYLSKIRRTTDAEILSTK